MSLAYAAGDDDTDWDVQQAIVTMKISQRTLTNQQE